MTDEPSRKTKGLDPQDWVALRRLAHKALDAALDHVQNRSERPVWHELPSDIKAQMSRPLPRKGESNPDDLVKWVQETVFSNDLGNTHPRFWGWVHGTGSPAGVIPAVLEAAVNANMGGRNHAPIHLEAQVVRWWRELFEFPLAAGGLVLSGTSMATIVAVKGALVRAGGINLRENGVANGPRFVGYTSEQAHSCIARAFDVLGLGKSSLRRVPTDNDFRLKTDVLSCMIAEDRMAGKRPFLVAGTAGTVNVASIDPLDEIADIAADETLWFHVDGAFGAMAIISDELRGRIAGIERADSVAFDFHKWMHVTYDAGLVLVRDQRWLVDAFSERPEYLRGHSQGMASGGTWPCELGPELSRGFRALKVWFQMSYYGLETLAACLEENVSQAGRLATLVDEHPKLERRAPVALNIVCFVYRFTKSERSNELTTRLVARMQTEGLAAPSVTTLDERAAIRVNLTNHRTRDSDLDALIDAVVRLGVELDASDR